MSAVHMPAYSHRQRAPIWILLLFFSIVFFTVAWTVRTVPVIPVVFPFVGLMMLILAGSFQYLEIQDQGDRLSIAFGPLPIFRTSVVYSEIEHMEIGKTMWIEGWGIHVSVRGGWVWNLWGWDCIVIQRQRGTIRIGTSDPEGLATFLSQRVAAPAVKGSQHG